MIVINGVRQPQAEGMTMSAYLEEKGYRQEVVAVECSGEIIPKSAYGEKVIRDGEIIEIVSFVGGG